MGITDLIFNNKKANKARLLAFGFGENNGQYNYSTPIVYGQFVLSVTVDADATVSAVVTDTTANEEYVLHLMPRAEGAFVGAVRTEYEHILHAIARQCFDSNVFKSDYAQAVIEHIRSTYGDELEFLWPRTPEAAIYRRPDSNKWYAVMMVVAKAKLGLDSSDLVDAINLKLPPQVVARIVDGQRYYSGYHMNKKHWVSICLDGSLGLEEIFEQIAASHALAGK